MFSLDEIRTRRYLDDSRREEGLTCGEREEVRELRWEIRTLPLERKILKEPRPCLLER